MAPQTVPVDTADQIQPLDYPVPLAGNPGQARFTTTVKRADGSSLAISDPQANRCILALMNFHAVLGGAACHWGGPAAYAEIIASIHGLMFDAEDWREAYNFVNDSGHAENGIYALKANYGYAGLSLDDLKGFRSLSSPLTGHGEATHWPEGVAISNGPLGSGIGMAQGLAMADAMAKRDRVTICTLSDGASFEGEAREALAAIPGLAGKQALAPFVLVVSDNNTKMCGRINEDTFDMQPTFQALQALGWKVQELDDGHDLQQVFGAVEHAVADALADPSVAQVVWCHTVKGKGVLSAEEAKTGGHGYPVKSAEQLRAFLEELQGGEIGEPVFQDWLGELEQLYAEQQAKKSDGGAPAEKIQEGLARGAIAAVEEGLPVVSVSADLQTSTLMANFHKQYPGRTRDLGIAESNMISAGNGFSKQGFIPIVDTFAQFGTTKGALPLIMGQISAAPVIAIFTHIGFQDAADGASHQSLQYLALVSAIPGVDVYCPACSDEAEWAMSEAIRRFAAARKAGEIPRTTVFFTGRETAPAKLVENADYRWGAAQVLADTTAGKEHSIVLSANASMVSYAQQAVGQLDEAGIGVVLLNNSTPNHPDVDGHAAALERCGNRLLTVEDHRTTAGAGSMLVTALVQAGIAPRLKLLGVGDDYGRSAYKAVQLYDHFGMGPDAMVAAGKELVGG